MQREINSGLPVDSPATERALIRIVCRYSYSYLHRVVFDVTSSTREFVVLW